MSRLRCAAPPNPYKPDKIRPIYFVHATAARCPKHFPPGLSTTRCASNRLCMGFVRLSCFAEFFKVTYEAQNGPQAPYSEVFGPKSL